MALESVSLYRQTLAERQRRYNVAILAQEYTPFIYPWDSLPALYLLLALVVTPRLPSRLAQVTRYITFILIVWHSLYVIIHRRTLWLACGYGIGLATDWGLIMSGALLILNDPGRDFRRLETRQTEPKRRESHQNGVVRNTTALNRPSAIDLTRRKAASVDTPTDSTQHSFSGSHLPATKAHSLVWQGFPFRESWFLVVDWVVDLVTSFRGVHWNHRISTLGEIEVTVPLGPGGYGSTAGVPRQSLRALQHRAMQDFAVYYLVLDLLKTTLITDPYFLGLLPLESRSPWPWLVQLNDAIPVATRVVRLLMSMAGVIAALEWIFSFSPLFFTLILPRLVDISTITKSPLLEPWMYAPHWASLTASVLRSGLAGFWGKYWHQMFRYGISEPSRVFIERFDMNRRGTPARIVQLLIAFGLSGSIHAAGAYTTFSLEPARPFSGPLMFFLAQGFGIIVQSSAVRLLFQCIPHAKTVPQAVRQASNLLFVMVYLYITGPLLANDFARCGIWLFEPVPISLFRGLGFGPGGKDEGWWAWYQEGSRWVGWWKGDRWWNTGLAVY